MIKNLNLKLSGVKKLKIIKIAFYYLFLNRFPCFLELVIKKQLNCFLWQKFVYNFKKIVELIEINYIAITKKIL